MKEIYRECGVILFGKRFFLQVKGKVYKSHVIWKRNLVFDRKSSTVAILRRTEQSLVRPMCCVKLVDKTNTMELMDMLELKETTDMLVRANGVRWYDHVLRQPETMF